MNISTEQLEGNMAKLTIEVEAEKFEKAINDVYNKEKGKINIPGFRKGKAPRMIIEKMYGPQVFFADAADKLIDEEYPNAYDECGLEIMSQPEIEVVQIEKGKPFIFSAKVALKPPVELGKYMGVTVTKIDTTVTEEEFEKELERNLSLNSRNVKMDRPVEDGDLVNIDYLGKCDGVAFQGGAAEGHKLKIGSNSFIPGFETQLIGHSAGEEFDIDVTFPEEYHAVELAGKPAVFTVKINEVTRDVNPELTDEYVQDSSEFETVEEYKNDIRTKLADRKAKEAERTKQNEAIEKIVDDCKVEISDPILDTRVEMMYRDFSQNIGMQGLPINQYFDMTGLSPESLRVQMRPEAEKQIRTSLVLEAIADKENIEVSDTEIEDKFKEMAAVYGMNAEDLMANVTDAEKDRMRKDLRVEKAVKLIGDNVKERAKAKSKKKEDEE